MTEMDKTVDAIIDSGVGRDIQVTSLQLQRDKKSEREWSGGRNARKRDNINPPSTGVPARRWPLDQANEVAFEC